MQGGNTNISLMHGGNTNISHMQGGNAEWEAQVYSTLLGTEEKTVR